MPSHERFHAFVDESSALREGDRQEYLIGAAIVPVLQEEELRGFLRPLLLPGQTKLHWSDESETRRKTIVSRLCDLDPINVVITHLSKRERKTERFRRKCLEELYYELIGMKVHAVTLESRSERQDSRDRAHIVAMQSQGLDRALRIDHLRGGDEPLLWIADAVLGAINAAHTGTDQHLEALSSTILVRRSTGDSLV